VPRANVVARTGRAGTRRYIEIGATPVMATSSMSMVFALATPLSRTAGGGLPILPCMRGGSAPISFEADSSDIAQREYGRFGMRLCRFRDCYHHSAVAILRPAQLSSYPAKAGIQYPAPNRVKTRRLWNTGSPAFAGDDEVLVARWWLIQRRRRGVEPQLVRCIERTADLATDAGAVVV